MSEANEEWPEEWPISACEWADQREETIEKLHGDIDRLRTRLEGERDAHEQARTSLEEALAQTKAELREYQRNTIKRDESVPEWADVWYKLHKTCWWESHGHKDPAPDLRPDEPGPITLPIVDVD